MSSLVRLPSGVIQCRADGVETPSFKVSLVDDVSLQPLALECQLTSRSRESVCAVLSKTS
jgi:hypothetical protein